MNGTPVQQRMGYERCVMKKKREGDYTELCLFSTLFFCPTNTHKLPSHLKLCKKCYSKAETDPKGEVNYEAQNVSLMGLLARVVWYFCYVNKIDPFR